MHKPIDVTRHLIRQLSHAIFALRPAIAATVLAFSSSVSTQTLDDYARLQIFDFEQCANACQIELDSQLFLCAPFREDKSQPAPKDCFKVNFDRYERCMNACPVDPRQLQ